MTDGSTFQRFRAFHEVQTAANTCVLACACMVARSHGGVLTQDALQSRLDGSPRGYPLENIAAEIGGKFLQVDLTSVDVAPWLRGQLNEGKLVVATLFSSVLAEWAEDEHLSPGPFGAMPGYHGLCHAVLLVGATSGVFWLLDPWYGAAVQPLGVEEDTLIRGLVGQVILVG